MKNSRKIFLAVLVVLIFVLGGISLYISIKIQQSIAPSNSSANTGTCVVTYPGGVTGQISITGCGASDSVQFQKHSKSVPAGSTDASCVGTSVSNPQTVSKNSSFDPRSGEACGLCVQYDQLGSDGKSFVGGSAQYTGDCKAVSKVNLEAEVFCQDDGGTKYEMPGITVTVVPGGDSNSSFVQNKATDSNGKSTFQFDQNQQGGAGTAVRLDLSKLPKTATLPTGQTFANLVSQSGDNAAINCQSGIACDGVGTGDTSKLVPKNCSPNKSSYEFCVLNSTGVKDKFKFRFTNCTPSIQNLNVSAAPVCSSNNQPIANVSWTARPGVDTGSQAYVIEINSTNNFNDQANTYHKFIAAGITTTDVPNGFTKVSDNNSQLGNLNPNTTYYVRVAYLSVPATYSTVASFTTNTCSSSTEPLFTVIKQSNSTCDVNGDQVLNYSITPTNIGAVSGTINYIQDQYDSNLVTNGIIPSNLSPSYGNVSGGIIKWQSSDTAERTYAANQSKTLTYQVRIPKSLLSTFISLGGIKNSVTVQYNTSTSSTNVATFELRSNIICAGGVIPNTGILDDARFLLVGMIFITLSLIVYKYKIGSDLIEDLIFPKMRRKKSSERFLEKIIDNN